MEKTETLKKNYEIKKTIKYGKIYAGKYLDFFILPNKQQKNCICFVVTKKTGNSVVRNRIKRKLRENYRQKEKEIILGFNIIIMWKKKAEKEFATYENIRKDFEICLEKARLIKK